jgi:hypothetical protein
VIGVETLDSPHADPALVDATLHDLRLLNRLFGGTRAVVGALTPLFERAAGERWTLLDVGTGSGDIPRALVAAAARRGLSLVPLAVERLPPVARAAREAGLPTVLADGGMLPFAPKSVDVVIVSQVLHHLPGPVAARWIAGLDRVARRAVVLADLRRSPAAMVGLWLSSFALGLHPATRHDGVVSLQRGYTVAELAEILRQAGVDAQVRRRAIARLVAVWEPTSDVYLP